jgi:hypothetical protein
VNWFGEDWGAPVCRAIDHTETPVGRKCERCGLAIKKGDRGIVIPAYFVWHIECFVKCTGEDPDDAA